MCESNREQRPLLCDDYSDEELHVRNYNCQRRTRQSVSNGRAGTHAKGAVTVLTRWPDHWTTSAGYWWLGISMIALTIFVIYNSVITIGMLQPPTKQTRFRTFTNGLKSKSQEGALPDIYMHLLISNSTELNLHKYLPHIDVMSRKFSTFKYKFIVVLNDTSKDVYSVDDEKRNEIALNSLWTENLMKENLKNNISIERISLTTYLNNSPIKKFWPHLPHHLVEFLLRSVSIWQKGGIAFNPLILTPESPNPNYKQRLHKMLKRYLKATKNAKYTKIKNKVHPHKKVIRPNNIRDIINELEKEDNNTSQRDLNGAENKDNAIVYNEMNPLKENVVENENKKAYDVDPSKIGHFEENITEKELNVSHNVPGVNNTEILNILPLFLKYLFHGKPSNNIIQNDTNQGITNKSENEDILTHKRVLPTNPQFLSSSTEDNSYDSPIATYKNVTIHKSESKMKIIKSDVYDNVPELSIDIKGNLIASRTPCHAFLGTMFSNVIHHTEEETVSDFIISELSLFCKGLITSCSGVDLILV